MIYTCCDENRRSAVEDHATLNGIDWLEVLDLDAPEEAFRQRTLMVRLLKPVPGGLNPGNVQIAGGERIRTIGVDWVGPASSPPGDPDTTQDERDFFVALDQADHVLLVRTDQAGDFSSYCLRLVRGPEDPLPPVDFDSRLREVDFSFKVECPSDFDCKPVRICPEEIGPRPDIDYLAKDYASFRRLMLDRLSRLVPGWRERSAADLGVTLTELLAYAADHLSYWQDAIATEAYLGTARRRVSLRRHALLVDYAMHEGSNARAWLQVKVAGGPVLLAADGVHFYSRTPGIPERVVPDSRDDREAIRRSPEVFEPMADALLFNVHETLAFYTWGDDRCCLPEGATNATLLDDPSARLRLRVGDVLAFEERRGPHTGEEEDADPRKRHVVRLTHVHPEAEVVLDVDGNVVDRTPEPLVLDPLTAGTADETAIVEIEWADVDALPFPLCISAQRDEEHGGDVIHDVSVALGNLVLVDHGLTISDESLGAVPEPSLHYPPERDAVPCDRVPPEPLVPRYRPGLAHAPLTQVGTVLRTRVVEGVSETERVAFDAGAPADLAFRWRVPDVLPAVVLTSNGTADEKRWTAQRDLMGSTDTERHFVVEVEHDGAATLRFGDDVLGRRPESGMTFTAVYRVGNGIAGNVGADAISHVVTSDNHILSVRNPMPARGGTEPETAAQVRRRAPQAFRRQERAVTERDYAEVTERHHGVQAAAATLRWTGSWHTVFITVDRTGGQPLDGTFIASLARHVNRFRMAGHDLHFNDPIFVSLEMDLLVCVAPDYFRSNVRAALIRELGNAGLADGRRGVFHPDNLSFGQTVYLSPIYAAAHGVAGVESVQITRFHRQGEEDPKPLSDGFMSLGRLEIPRLDNDRNFPEHGVLRLALFGGK